MAVTEVIEEINLHAQMYLDSFVDDMNVMLVFDGVKLNVEVMQGGHDSDIQNLSGGELARVILAFTIALAESNARVAGELAVALHVLEEQLA